MTLPAPDPEFTVTDDEVAGRELEPAGIHASLADRERTFLLGLAALAVGSGVTFGLGWALIIPGAILTVLGLLSLIGADR